MKDLIDIDKHPNVANIYFRVSSSGGPESARLVLQVFLRSPNICRSFFGQNGLRDLPKVLSEVQDYLATVDSDTAFLD